MILNSLQESNLFALLSNLSLFSMSRSEGDGCTFSLITAIITQWWHNKLSNNYSLPPSSPCLFLPHSPNRSLSMHKYMFAIYFNSQGKTASMSFIILHVNIEAKQDQHQGAKLLPCWAQDVGMVTLSIMPNLQDCWLNLHLCLTYTKKKVLPGVPRGIHF